ncbi:MAG: hypothetical protein A3G32_06905 [Deltaproteobacteria bacterium RIFCSPLOWO2_12_FULL_40_28]|nr:MAG: hypothetical protein A3C45_06950 [Deltaproteobacteria bacterium RIFCSPHIGHO2_02_FULL_40_28]OGQ19313.1 MAG: hypothetical protein A3E27_04865 [Deltaproteobacteria bacterium RIFCSPHIGHO2_12_FULL_40_32]OGQ40463.1 MAG: hypothetical protein A3I69_00205 [Deltaproteobacteria bacterium RIFCSPLOWO2_02_FULL_40_36]OGQ53699.1 MAG: hypothetical protein A3G32_06905 [Deltaproteobacteria bacterium RIFCSPLOWO2_12_FULL_40_28]
MGDFNKKLALVLSGGGARGAYEAGVIHYIRTKLKPEISRKRNFDIVCGSSVGAINTCFVAATSHDLDYQGKKAYELWKNMKQEYVYQRGMIGLTKLAGRTVAGVLGNFFSKTENDGKKRKYHFVGFLDPSPLPSFLKEVIPWKQIALNIQHGLTKAISLTATNIHTGRMELFIDKHPSLIYSGRHRAHFVNIEVAHAMASAAIPILFPTVCIGKDHYCDGGVRSNTPISPAIHLGTDKALVIGLHQNTFSAPDVPGMVTRYDTPPTMGEIIGNVLKIIFLDRLDYDVAQLQRINEVIYWGKKVYGDDFLDRMNQQMTAQGGTRDIAARGLKQIEIFNIYPSRDIRSIFAECVTRTQYLKKQLSVFEKTLLKILDVDLSNGLDFLTFILFVPEFLQQLLELGFEDARSSHAELERFFLE